METKALLEEETSMLNSEMRTVRDTMEQLDEELSATKLRCDELISVSKNGSFKRNVKICSCYMMSYTTGYMSFYK